MYSICLGMIFKTTLKTTVLQMLQVIKNNIVFKKNYIISFQLRV